MIVSYLEGKDIEVRHCLVLQLLGLEAFRRKHDVLRRLLRLRGSKGIQKGQEEESLVATIACFVASKGVSHNHTGR